MGHVRSISKWGKPEDLAILWLFFDGKQNDPSHEQAMNLGMVQVLRQAVYFLSITFSLRLRLLTECEQRSLAGRKHFMSNIVPATQILTI